MTTDQAQLLEKMAALEKSSREQSEKVRLLEAQVVRPGAAGLLTGMEYSRVEGTAWVHPASNCNYSYSSRTSLRTRKLPDPLGVGLWTYSVRTFHVTLLPRII